MSRLENGLKVTVLTQNAGRMQRGKSKNTEGTDTYGIQEECREEKVRIQRGYIWDTGRMQWDKVRIQRGDTYAIQEEYSGNRVIQREYKRLHKEYI